jgi:hypothetical protein
MVTCGAFTIMQGPLVEFVRFAVTTYGPGVVIVVPHALIGLTAFARLPVSSAIQVRPAAKPALTCCPLNPPYASAPFDRFMHSYDGELFAAGRDVAAA